MPYSNPERSDDALDWWATVDVGLYLCSAEPATYTEATSTYALANKTAGFSFGGPNDAVPDGRKIVSSAIEAGSPGTVTASGTATHWAVVDIDNATLIYAGELAASQVLVSGSAFTLAAFEIRLPAASNAE